MNKIITDLAGKVLTGELLDQNECRMLLDEAESDYDDLLYWANRIRQANFGNKVKMCSIVPARLGGCDQDCAFCAQSVRYNTNIDKRAKLLSDEEILAAARNARDNGVRSFGIVYSGRAITDEELDRVIELAKIIKNDYGLQLCGSLGTISAEQAKLLADAGFSRYNHNVETSRSHFPNIVTTHKFDDRVKTIKNAISAGLGVCGGGLFGLGETQADRIEMAIELRDLGVDMVPMNFLHPIEGTPMGDNEPMQPREILTTVALYRFILPKASLKVAGGRKLNLRTLQSWIFQAGATSIITGDYLTTAGSSVSEDVQMLKDLGLEPC
ncbi:Biotin synthase [Anaerohalosphaera lusitana]|uniref:Biotin synthase n=1 Tax=Anaerohalosphaera lusitana TaxID=1936003 RepID=A0A1U9NMA8_9BACT|nr:biotin synthase BioB [Anaerohalosphaera lusitana]AQT69043.1 Biotin synthase [Anaerohalosphaera lusitana]